MPFLVTLPAISGFVLLKYEHWTIDVFELWCWRRLLRGPWTAGRSNQSILTEINPEYSLEGLLLKLKLQYFDCDEKTQLIRKDPDAGKDWGQEEQGATEDEMIGWHHWLNGQDLSNLQEMVKDRVAWHVAVHGVPRSCIWLNNWTTPRTEYLVQRRGYCWAI